MLTLVVKNKYTSSVNLLLQIQNTEYHNRRSLFKFGRSQTYLQNHSANQAYMLIYLIQVT